MRDRAHDDTMAEMFREDPEYAIELINSILEDGDQRELLITLRQLAKAFGGVPAVAETAHLSATQLYRTLSPDGNPVLSSLSAILKAMGLRLAVQPMQGEGAHAQPVRSGWAEASKTLAAAGDDDLVLPEFANAEGEAIEW